MTFDPKEARALVERLDGYTPGPWEQDHRVTQHGGYSTQVFPANDPTNTIATLHWHSIPFAGGFRTDRGANAHLIAAAPDLHAHLVAALDEIERLRDARVRPLVWYNQPEGQDVRIGRCGQIAYAVGFKLGAWGYQRHGDSGHTISRPGGVSFKDEPDAIDGADEDHERRILEALIDGEPEPQEPQP